MDWTDSRRSNSGLSEKPDLPFYRKGAEPEQNEGVTCVLPSCGQAGSEDRTSLAARKPVSIAEKTVPVCASGAVASPAKKRVSPTGAPNRRGSSRPFTGR